MSALYHEKCLMSFINKDNCASLFKSELSLSGAFIASVFMLACINFEGAAANEAVS